MSSEAKTKVKTKKKFLTQVYEPFCKGCNICVTFCPKGVLKLERNLAVVAHPEDCIGCNMCEMRCPDFAIEVEFLGEEIIEPAPAEEDVKNE